MLKMVNTEYEIMVFDDLGRVFLVLKNPYNSEYNDVVWQLPKENVEDDFIKNQASKLLKKEYDIIVNNSEIFCACESITDLEHLISIGLVSYDSDTSHVQINDIKSDIAYNFYDLDALPKNICDSSKLVINNYRNRKQ